MTQATLYADFAAGPKERWQPRLAAIAVIAAAVASALTLWWVSGSLPLAGGMAASGILGGVALGAWQQRRPAAQMAGDGGTDWTLVRAISDSAQCAIAVTDRTGRLVLANNIYCDWFEGPITPPALPVDAPTVALIAEVGRAAWRDGEGAISGFRCNGREISASVLRVGRASDHLLWQWRENLVLDPVAAAENAIADWPGRIAGEAGAMVALVSATGTIRAANAAFALRAVGRADARVEGQDFASFLRVDPQGLIRFAREQAGAGATPLRLVEIAFERADPAAPLLLLLFDEDGGPAERGIAHDYVENLLAALPVGMAMVDRDGRIAFFNAAFARAAGIDSSRPPSYPGDLVVAEDKSALADAVRRHGGARASSGELTVRLLARAEEQVVIGLTGVRGMGEANVLLTLAEAEGDAQLRTQMAQATKMQAVGQLAGGIAHDFNNILTGIIGNCDLMLTRHSAGDSDYDDIQQVRSNANRAANLTRQLLAFSRQQTLRPQIVNLSDIVSDVSHLLERLIGDRVQLQVDHGRGLSPVRADPGQLEQVIMNLAVNAGDAMPHGGQLTIATRPVEQAEVRRLARAGMPVEDYSLLTVADTGSGIAPEVLPKIFDPFFTTKDLGKGTGLGLATVYGIVKQSGGYIFVDSKPGEGTIFSIYFPVYAGPAVPQAAPPPPRSAHSVHWGSGNILLVEDEDMVRAVAERALSRAGYSVTSAAHGEEGLERLAAMDSIDLVISDVMMPQMDGPTMVQHLRESQPHIPVLFMSGYAEEQLRKSIALDNVAFLPKPFSVAQLVDAVASIRASAGSD